MLFRSGDRVVLRSRARKVTAPGEPESLARMAQEAEAQRESTVQQEAEAQEPAAGEGA